MSEPNPMTQRRRFGLHDLEPAVKVPWWRRGAPSFVLFVPVMVTLAVELVDIFSTPGVHQASPWVGLALCALWAQMLVRAIVPLARHAWWIEALLAAFVMLALLRRLELDSVLLDVLAPAAAAALMVAIRRRAGRRVQPVERSRIAPSEVAGAVAFSETSANGSRAWLIVAGCVLFAGAGGFMIWSNGPSGWWYVAAALVWMTGAIPWMLRVTLDRGGLVVRSLVLPGALVRIPLDDIADLRAGVAYRKHWGGGFGISVDGPTTTLLRTDGAAVLVTRTDGSQVIVNVDRPDEATATWAALRAGGAA